METLNTRPRVPLVVAGTRQGRSAIAIAIGSPLVQRTQGHLHTSRRARPHTRGNSNVSSCQRKAVHKRRTSRTQELCGSRLMVKPGPRPSHLDLMPTSVRVLSGCRRQQLPPRLRTFLSPQPELPSWKLRSARHFPTICRTRGNLGFRLRVSCQGLASLRENCRRRTRRGQRTRTGQRRGRGIYRPAEGSATPDEKTGNRDGDEEEPTTGHTDEDTDLGNTTRNSNRRERRDNEDVERRHGR